jgi:hypothetical protein
MHNNITAAPNANDDHDDDVDCGYLIRRRSSRSSNSSSRNSKAYSPHTVDVSSAVLVAAVVSSLDGHFII